MSNYSLPSGTVTFLFTDIEGSTKLWEEHPEAMKAALAKHDVILKKAIESNHGHIIKTTGDGVHAVFTTALDAVNTSVNAQRELTRMKDEGGRMNEEPNQENSSFITHPSSFVLKVRMGLHTGEAELRDGDYFGGTLNRAARIMSAGHGGQILISDVTAQVVREHLPADVSLLDLGEHHLKGLLRAEKIYQVVSPDLHKNFPALNSISTATNNLPAQLTSFIGREREMKEAAKRFSDARLLTLIGPGGTGKTRLSIQLGTEMLPNFADGVWFIELAPLADSAYVISTVASVFNLREVQGMSLINIVMDYLRGRQLLIILDNCEHLVETCAQLANQLLHECPQLKMVASSREALGINGETVYRVPSLMDDEATRLFVERATKADSRFKLTEHNASPIVQICSRLDGIPLAIELAAARVKLFSPEQIAERLDDRFKLLTGGSRTALPRQQTLRALIDWSYQTLTETEQRALRRLAVFSGGWTFEAAEAVIRESEALDGLAGLVNKSLVNVEEQDGKSRYFFLETIRQYAMEKLVETGEANETRNRHLDYLLKLIVQPKPDLFGIALTWLEQIDSEHDNLRAALEWGVANDIGKAMQLALKVNMYWSTRDFMGEALFWYKAILQKSETLSGYDSERASIYSLMGWNSILIGQHRDGRTASETAIALAKKVDDARVLVFSACTLALASAFLGDLATAQNVVIEAETAAREKGFKEELAFVTSARAQVIYYTTRDAAKAKKYLDEAVHLSTEVGYRWETAFLTFGQARLAAMLGDVETARIKFEEGSEMARHMGNKRMVYSNRSEYAHVLRETGHLDEAYAIYMEVIPGWKDLGHRAAVAHELECIGYILTRKEEPERAVKLLSAAQTIRKVIDMPRTQIEDDEYDQELSTLRGLLSEAEFEKNWDNGMNLSMDKAIELALKG
jgi:predicted ATPase/class 3 adenylate cyclase